MEYLAWNNEIGKRFFNPDKNGARVFFYVTKDVVNQIGMQYNTDFEDFLSAVKIGSPWNTRHGQGICQQALQVFHNWRSRNLDYPPYLCYLALFVIADTIDAGSASYSYYPGLRCLLGEQEKLGMYPSFDRMYHLWDDLSVWSHQDRQGEWGIFDADIVGEWVHVGLPRSQTLLTDEERDKLPFLFANNGFDPYSPPSERELAYLLTNDSHLMSHTKERLKSTSENDAPIRRALMEMLLDELEHWDGSVSIQSGGEKFSESRGILRLAMKLDSTAKKAQFFLRCRSSREYPENRLQFHIEDECEKNHWCCTRALLGWSEPLCETHGQPFDASRLDWLTSLTLVDTMHKWKISFPKRSSRVMLKTAGLDGFVEESRIPQDKPFYLLVHSDKTEIVCTNIQDHCEGFQKMNFSGLPQDWHLFKVESAASAVNIIRNVLPSLAPLSDLRIHLQGGLKIHRNKYFKFALPHIQVPEADKIECNKILLEIHPLNKIFIIPDEVQANRLVIEAHRGSEVCRKTFYVGETLSWQDIKSTANFDKFGRKIDGEENESCTGSIVRGVNPPVFRAEQFLPINVGHCIYFIGRHPGEIVEYPKEAIPEWMPVWAVALKRGRGKIAYCGVDFSKEEPTCRACTRQNRLRLWRDILWYKRKRISLPTNQTLRTLWNKYKNAAKPKHVR